LLLPLVLLLLLPGHVLLPGCAEVMRQCTLDKQNL
jgi:hypothetical protein